MTDEPQMPSPTELGDMVIAFDARIAALEKEIESLRNQWSTWLKIFQQSQSENRALLEQLNQQQRR